MSKLSSLYFVIPTLVRADKLEKCLRSIRLNASGAHVEVINNWTHRGVERVLDGWLYSHDSTERDDTKVVITLRPENAGVAASWNIGLSACFADRAANAPTPDVYHRQQDRNRWAAIVLNDDVELLPGTVQALRDALEGGLALAWSAQGWCCFAITEMCWNVIGKFDENFWPAYHEDEDYLHRIRLAGLKADMVKNAQVLHEPSSTMEYSELFRFQHRRTDHQNLIYYGHKWGGVPNFERHTTPFGSKGAALSYWPEPKKRSWNVKLDSSDKVALVPSDRPFSVRLYGNFFTNGSFGRVSRGLEEGLTELGLLAGKIEADSAQTDEHEATPGADAPVGLFAGNPSFIGAITSHGLHEMNFAILAPNSSWVPERLIAGLKRHAAIVAPSSWGARVLQEHGCQAFPPLRHGVSKGFEPVPALAEAMRKAYDDGHFRVLHMSSTDKQRKGTPELIAAWRFLVQRHALGPNPRLEIIVDAPPGTYPEAENEPTIVMNFRRLNATVETMKLVYHRYHVVCQPSRGEGFGMCPLEARACGIPVVATNCTGHAEHMGNADDGCIVVGTSADVPIDDGPGAMAPHLPADELTFALLQAFLEWKVLHERALKHAAGISNEWSWARQLSIWLKEMALT